MRKKNINEFLLINGLNLIVLLMLYVCNSNIIISTVVVCLYLIYIFTNKNLKIIEYQFSFMIMCSTILDTTYSTNASITPMWAKYITELISIILLFKLIINKERFNKIIKDKIFLLFILIGSLGTIYSIFNNNSFNVIFDTYRRIFRFIPVYLALAYIEIDKQDLKNKFNLYFTLNMLVFVIQCISGVGKDFRNGMFGKISTAAFNYFIILFSTHHINLYIMKKESGFLTIGIILASLISIVLQDGKAYMLIYICFCVAIIIIYNKNILKKLAVIVALIIAFPIGMEVMKTVSPNATFFYNSNNLLKTALEYIQINNSTNLYELNRFEAVNHVFEVENDTIMEKLFGNGIGSSFGPENEYYSKIYQYENNQKTRLNINYGHLGYQLSSTNLILLDFGYIGIIVIIALIIKFIQMSINIISTDNLLNRVIGMTVLCVIISLVYNLYYGNQFFTREPSYIMFFIIGILQNLYSKRKES